MNRNSNIRSLTAAALITACYAATTLLAGVFSVAAGPIQFRFSEALCVLPCFLPEAVPGLFLGCVLGNLLIGSALPDILFGSLATLLGAIGTRFLRRRRAVALLCPVAANMLIIPPILSYVYHFEGSLSFFAITVGAGELVCCLGLGLLLGHALDRVKLFCDRE